MYFNYIGGRSDTPTGYVGGAYVQEPKVLSNVDIREPQTPTDLGARIKVYLMGYDTNPTTLHARLRTVQECADDNLLKCLAPTSIAYENGPAEGFVTTAQNAPAGQPGCGVYSPDLNGDGRSDLVWASYEPPGPLSCHWKVRFATATGYSADVALTTDGTNPLAPPMFGLFGGSSSVTQVLLGVPYQGDGTFGAGNYRVLQYDAATNSFLGTNVGFPPLGDTAADNVGDYDGDGLSDLFILDKINTGNIVNLYLRRNTSTASSLSFSPTWTQLGTFVGGQTPVNLGGFKTGDFNGDGMTDYVWTLSYYPVNIGAWVNLSQAFISNGAPGGTTAQPTKIGEWAGIPGTDILAVVNWNGDGCSDVIAHSVSSGHVAKVWLSNCKDGFIEAVTLPVGLSSANGLVVLDYNGDGLDDLVFHEAQTPGTASRSTTYQVIKSTGTGASAAANTGIVLGAGAWLALATDKNGDGLLDLAVVPQLPGRVLVHVVGQLAQTALGDGPAGAIPAQALEALG